MFAPLLLSLPVSILACSCVCFIDCLCVGMVVFVYSVCSCILLFACALLFARVLIRSFVCVCDYICDKQTSKHTNERSNIRKTNACKQTGNQTIGHASKQTQTDSQTNKHGTNKQTKTLTNN